MEGDLVGIVAGAPEIVVKFIGPAVFLPGIEIEALDHGLPVPAPHNADAAVGLIQQLAVGAKILKNCFPLPFPALVVVVSRGLVSPALFQLVIGPAPDKNTGVVIRQIFGIRNNGDDLGGAVAGLMLEAYKIACADGLAFVPGSIVVYSLDDGALVHLFLRDLGIDHLRMVLPVGIQILPGREGVFILGGIPDADLLLGVLQRSPVRLRAVQGIVNFPAGGLDLQQKGLIVKA